MRILWFTPMVVTLFFAGYREVSSILLDLEVSEKRCISDSVQGEADTSFRYRFAEGIPEEEKQVKVKVKVTKPDGRSDPTAEDLGVKWGKNVIDKDEHPGGGTYKICFQNSRERKTRVELVHDIVKSKDEKNEGMDKHLVKAHELLKTSKDMLNSLKGQMKETITGEVSDVHEDEMLRSRINTGSCFTMVVVIAASAWQLVLLNKFFRSKKLI